LNKKLFLINTSALSFAISMNAGVHCAPAAGASPRQTKLTLPLGGLNAGKGSLICDEVNLLCGSAR
jgi:hypothetical protein